MRKLLVLLLLFSVVGCQPSVKSSSGYSTKKNKAAEERIARKAANRAERQQSLQRKASQRQRQKYRQQQRGRDNNPFAPRRGSGFLY